MLLEFVSEQLYNLHLLIFAFLFRVFKFVSFYGLAVDAGHPRLFLTKGGVFFLFSTFRSFLLFLVCKELKKDIMVTKFYLCYIN